ncbi:MAG: alpha/beta hydrolase [Candidatus Thorarchaeota archaeon]
MDIVLLIILILVGSLLLTYIGLVLYKTYLRFSTRIETSNGISSLEEVTLGDLKQWIFIRGTDQNNPILVFLHGGPGEPAVGISSSRKLDAELIKHFTVVHWDQRGAGKTYNSDIPVESMTLDRLVEDCNELIDYLRNRFGTQKVFVVGHSSGTLIGIKTAYKYPEKIHAYVGVSQVINDYEQQRISYEHIVKEAEKSGNVKDQISIKEVGPPYYETPEKEFEKARLIIRYGGMMHDFSMKKMLGIVIAYFTSPEYSLAEAIRTIRGNGLKFTTNSLWQEIIHINFKKEIESVAVPIYFFGGKSDMITPTVLVEDFYNSLDAEKGKKFIIFEKSGHWPMLEEKDKYDDSLINVVLKESQRNQ